MTERFGLVREFLGRCWRTGPVAMLVVLGCLVLNMVSFALIGIGMRSIVNGTVHDDPTVMVLGAVGAAVAYTVDMTISEIGFMLRIHLVERVAVAEIETATLRDATGIETIEHLEHSDYLDRIALVRGESWAIVDSAWAVVEAVVLAVRLLLTVAVLGSVSPSLLVLVAFAAVPTVFEQRGRRRIQRVETETAELRRLERHLFALATEPATSKELRVAGTGADVVARQRAAWDRSATLRFRARLVAACWSTAGWLVFGVGFVGGLAVVIVQAGGRPSAAGDLVMVVTVGLQLRWAVEAAVRRSADTGGYGRLLEPFLWLRRYSARAAAERR